MNEPGVRPTRRQKLKQVAAALKAAGVLRKNERLAPEALRAHQLRLLQSLVDDTRERSEWWRRRLPAGPVDLERLPVMSKEELVGEFGEMVCDPTLTRDSLLEHLHSADCDVLAGAGYRVMATSGSSGTPGLFVYDRGAWTVQMAQTMRATEWVGVRPSFPRKGLAVIGGSNPAHMTRRLSESLDVGMHRILRFGVTDPIDEIVAGLNEFDPDFLVTYPSTLGPLAEAAQRGELRIDPKAIQATSEPLTPAVRRLCESAFGQPPSDFFGSTEGLFGGECEECDGIHLYEDCTLVEVVDADNRPVPDGEPGTKMLVTNLNNRVQPLIRLELSDSVTISPDPCPCGRTLRRLQALDGRSNDVMELGGARVHPQHFGLLGRDASVRAFQVVQEGDAVRLRLVLGSDADPIADSERLASEVRAELAAAGVGDPRVVAEPVEAIERAPSGKMHQIVAEPPGPGGQPTAPDSRSEAISSAE